MASRPTGVPRSTTTLRLPRLAARKVAAMPCSDPGPMRRAGSPSGGSTFTTSAPASASNAAGQRGRDERPGLDDADALERGQERSGPGSVRPPGWLRPRTPRPPSEWMIVPVTARARSLLAR